MNDAWRQSECNSPEKAVSSLFAVVKKNIGEIVKTYGKDDMLSFLAHEIRTLSTNLNIGKNVTGAQIVTIAELVIESYPYYRVDDFKAFFTGVLLGKYGKSYDRFDSQIFFEWLNLYDQEREALVVDYNTRKSQQAKEDSKHIAPSVLAVLKEATKPKEAAIEKLKPQPNNATKLTQTWINAFNRRWENEGIDCAVKVIYFGGKNYTVNNYLEYRQEKFYKRLADKK